jgi:hypothetical protein
MRELPFFVAVGGSAADASDVVEAVRLVTLDKFEGPRVLPFMGVDRFAGDRSAIAEVGRGGSLPAAFAFLFSSNISLSAVRLFAPAGLAVCATTGCDA